MHLRLLSQKNLLMKFFRKKQKTYEKTKEVFGNPLMGYAPCAWNESVRGDVTLLYMDITWRNLSRWKAICLGCDRCGKSGGKMAGRRKAYGTTICV